MLINEMRLSQLLGTIYGDDGAFHTFLGEKWSSIHVTFMLYSNDGVNELMLSDVYMIAICTVSTKLSLCTINGGLMG